MKLSILLAISRSFIINIFLFGMGGGKASPSNIKSC
mgnify:CR=1 FL=1